MDEWSKQGYQRSPRALIKKIRVSLDSHVPEISKLRVIDPCLIQLRFSCFITILSLAEI